MSLAEKEAAVALGGGLTFLISSLHNKEIEVVLVSSGARGFGLIVLDLDKRPAEVGKQQAVSSVGDLPALAS